MGNHISKATSKTRNRNRNDPSREYRPGEHIYDNSEADVGRYTSVQHGTYAEISNTIRDDLFVAAIDFGTSASGYALSSYYDYLRDPLTIHSFNWYSKADGFLHYKTLTAILLDPDGKFDSFGYDAEWKYVNLDNEDHTRWYFLKNFKMELFRDKDLSRYSVIHDVNGKPCLALDIFAHSISYLKGHLISTLKSQMNDIKSEDVFWILTVPAIWSEKAKQFMRIAAYQAGIVEDKLAIALEPEAAAIYCRQLPISRQIIHNTCNGGPAFKPGSRYLVVDLGGGTVDITAHAIREDGALEELMAATGGDWGSNYINEEFMRYFENVTAHGVLSELKTLFPDDYINFMTSFENKKRSFSLTDRKIHIAFPSTLKELLHSRLEVPVQTHFQNKGIDDIKLKRDKLTVCGTVFKRIIIHCVDNIVSRMKSILVSNYDNMKIGSIILVGGFAECDVLKQKVSEVFSEYRIIIPQEPVLAVLKGAVLFGRNPRILHARVCRYTYGICTTRDFIEGMDPLNKLVQHGNKKILIDVFKPHIYANQVVKIGELLPCVEYTGSINKNNLQLRVYAAEQISPKFVTDPDVQYLGNLTLHAPIHCQTSRFVVRFMLDGTELEVSVLEVTTGQEVKGKFNFLG